MRLRMAAVSDVIDDKDASSPIPNFTIKKVFGMGRHAMRKLDWVVLEFICRRMKESGEPLVLSYDDIFDATGISKDAARISVGMLERNGIIAATVVKMPTHVVKVYWLCR